MKSDSLPKGRKHLREFQVNQIRMVYGQPDKEVIITPQLESVRSIKGYTYRTECPD